MKKQFKVIYFFLKKFLHTYFLWKKGFLPDLFQKWSSIGVNHVISIIMFSRVFHEIQDGEIEKYPELNVNHKYSIFF